jgi:hypothetical protein
VLLMWWFRLSFPDGLADDPAMGAPSMSPCGLSRRDAGRFSLPLDNGWRRIAGRLHALRCRLPWQSEAVTPFLDKIHAVPG